MELIASCTATLKKAIFQPFESDLDVSMFQLIDDANRSLEHFEIDTYYFHESSRRAESALGLLNELVIMFAKCRKLSFRIWCSHEPEEVEIGVTKEDLVRICKALPCRGVDVYVRVGHVVYEYPNPLSLIQGIEEQVRLP